MYIKFKTYIKTSFISTVKCMHFQLDCSKECWFYYRSVFYKAPKGFFLQK